MRTGSFWPPGRPEAAGADFPWQLKKAAGCSQQLREEALAKFHCVAAAASILALGAAELQDCSGPSALAMAEPPPLEALARVQPRHSAPQTL